jgi:hypothetical protein
MKTPSQRELNEKVLQRYGRTLVEIARDPNANVGPVFEWLKRRYSKLPSREFGRVMGMLREVLFFGITDGRF